MDILNQIIEKLNKEEARNLKLFYGNQAYTGRKDLVLFNYIRNSGNNFKEEKALKKLHYQNSKNSYYRLKNRLIEDIGDSLLLLHTHKSEQLELFQFIELYQFYRSRNQYKVCLFYLRKAERLALAIENYELLDIVYSGLIKLSAELADVEPVNYIKKRESNLLILASLRELDDILAILAHRLKISQNFGELDRSMLRKLQLKVEEITKRTTSGYGRNLSSRIYNALSQVFLQQHNYVALEKLVKDNYRSFERNKWFDKSNHEQKLQMLTYAGNALFKNHKNKESLEYSVMLGNEIEQYGKSHYEKYLFFYYNLQVLNYAVLDPPKGLQALDQFEREMRKKENTYYDFFIYLNRAALLYDLGKYNQALKNLVRLYVSDGYLKADAAFKLRIEVSELIITFESGEMDTLLYRVEQVRKSFGKLLEKKEFKRDREVIQLIKDMQATPNYLRDEKIQKRIKAILKEKYSPVEEDVEVIKYRTWLNQKLRK
ncbi:MAG TPA: hypothetical protein VG603_16690 [Chitinophagales bacterium]|nr:hypothetical protein [Chitinophagales bacterium]